MALRRHDGIQDGDSAVYERWLNCDCFVQQDRFGSRCISDACFGSLLREEKVTLFSVSVQYGDVSKRRTHLPVVHPQLPEAWFEFPLTQRELADTLGLSAVHVNRTLQVLRSQGLIELSRQRLTILDKAGLYEAAEFDPRYLDGWKPAEQDAD